MNSPLFNHALHEPTAFRPQDLVAAVRQQRGAGSAPIPLLGILEFDGDLTDKLIAQNQVRRCEDWPCFHTDMWLWPKDNPLCGIVARTIGGPYTVLIAEQMAVCGMDTVVGLASAGRIGRTLPLPGIVVADEAVRDEGTSLHYLPPTQTVRSDQPLARALAAAMPSVGLPVRRGLVWTTDAPYRETPAQIDHWAACGALAVEMQAASLFAFGQARQIRTGLVAHVTNAIDHDGEPFHKGPDDADLSILAAIVEGSQASTAPDGNDPAT
jgi:uridine phosphorylase